MEEVERSMEQEPWVGVRGIKPCFKRIYRLPLILTFSPRGRRDMIDVPSWLN